MARRSVPPEDFRLSWRSVLQLFPSVWRHRWRVAFAIFLLLAAKVATVTVPLVLRSIVDALDRTLVVELVLPLGLLLLYGALRLGSSLFSELQTAVFSRVRQSMMRELSVDVLRHLHRLSLRFHLTRQTGAISQDLGRGTRSLATLLNYLLFNIVPTLVEIALVTIILFAEYDVRYVLVVVVTFTLYVIATLVLTEWRMPIRREKNTLESKANSRAVDSLLNFETVKYFTNEEYEIDRYEDELIKWEDAAVKTQYSLSVLNIAQGAIIAAGVTVIIIMAGQGVVDGELTIGDLVAINAFLLQLFAPLGFLGTVYSILKHAMADMERMFSLLEEPPEIVDVKDAQPLKVRRGEIRFEDVRFAYDQDRPILKGIDLTVPPGHKVALVGPSGAGKSTIGRLLFRFYDPTSGRVTIDGQDISTVTQKSLRDAIGVVPQDTVLFNDTLRANILYARQDASQQELDEAARMANLTEFIESLPQGWDTIVGERGLKLSGGEKQRVAIARVILKAPPILLFDEATSSLDSESEQEIMTALARLAEDQTTLSIAHRLSTITDSDRIIFLQNGEIIEEGTHDELLARGGRYAELWRIQAEEGDDQDSANPA